MEKIFYNHKRSIEFYTDTYVCLAKSQHNLLIIQTNKLRSMKRVKGPTKGTKRQTKTYFCE